MTKEKSKAQLRCHMFSHMKQRNFSMSAYHWALEKLVRVIFYKKGDQFGKILHAVGKFGTFQRRLAAFTIVPKILLAFFTFADYFVFTDQTHYCNTSWILAMDPNLSEAEQLNMTLPRAPDGNFLSCLMYLPVPWDLNSIIQFGLNSTTTCQNGWIYPDSKKRSLINEFDLVCDKRSNKEIVQPVFMAGLLAGSLIFGVTGDKLGRYPTILLSLLGFIIFGFGTAFVNSFKQYLFFRFMVSQAVIGYAISSVCLATEWLLTKHRAHVIIMQHCFFAVGSMFLTGLAYSLPHWRLLFLAAGIPVFPLISYIWILPESPRWLVTIRKVEEAKKALCYAAGVNKKSHPPSALLSELSRKQVAKAHILDFYRNRYLRKLTLVMGCVWFTLSYTYFTLSLEMTDFRVSIHFRQVSLAIIEVSTRLCCIFLLELKGRKWTLAVMLIQTTTLCFLLRFLPRESESLIILMFLLGESSLAVTVTVFFIYTAELLPTVVRATGLGLVSLASATGALLSVTVNNQIPLLSIIICCILTIVALCFSFLLPETQDEPLFDSLEHFSKVSNGRRDTSETTTPEDSSSENVTEETMKNTILNAHNLTKDGNMSSSTDLQQHEPEAGYDATSLRTRPPGQPEEMMGVDPSGPSFGLAACRDFGAVSSPAELQKAHPCGRKGVVGGASCGETLEAVPRACGAWPPAHSPSGWLRQAGGTFEGLSRPLGALWAVLRRRGGGTGGGGAEAHGSRGAVVHFRR
ncbi:solute carrier family 22 member 14 [Ctenodactylus gundi]